MFILYVYGYYPHFDVAGGAAFSNALRLCSCNSETIESCAMVWALIWATVHPIWTSIRTEIHVGPHHVLPLLSGVGCPFCGLGNSEFLFFVYHSLHKILRDHTDPLKSNFAVHWGGTCRSPMLPRRYIIHHSSQGQGYGVHVWMLTWVMGAKNGWLLDTDQNWCFSCVSVQFCTSSVSCQWIFIGTYLQLKIF